MISHNVSRLRRALCASPRCVAACVALVALAAVHSAAGAAQAVEAPLIVNLRVVPPPGVDGPPPTGRIQVRLDGELLLSLALTRGSVPLIAARLDLAGHSVTVSYSGDGFYDPSGGLSITLPTRDIVTIIARPIDRLAPEVTVLAPVDGARYARGEVVVARYSCNDSGGTAGAVTRCEATVADGQPIDTSTLGEHAFRVDARDAAGNASSRVLRYRVDADATTGSSGPPERSVPPVGAPGSGQPPQLGPSELREPVPLAVAPAPLALPPAPPSSQPQQRDEPTAAPPAAATTPEPASSPAAPPASAAARSSSQLAAYDPRSEPVKVVGLMVAAFTLLQFGLGRGGLAVAGGSALLAGRAQSSRAGGQATRRDGGRQSGSEQPQFDMGYEGVDVEQLEGGAEAVKAGDRSRTWGWPGTALIDAMSSTIPAALAVRSPLLARVTADGSYLRAMLGSAAIVALCAGIALGVAAVHDTSGEALPPALSLTIAITVLGIVDAVAGLAAALTFVVGVALLGGIDSAPAVRTLLGLAALWFVVPILAGAARPLRRPPPIWLEETWDRVADFVIGSLIGAWAVQQIVLALPGLAGLELPIADHANTIATAVLLTLVVRLAAETLAAFLYPERLAEATPHALPEPGPLPRLGAVAIRTAIFVFLAVVVVGSSWQLWVGTSLFVAPQVLAVFEDRLPNSPALFRALPKGLVELVLMLLVATALGALLIHTMDESADAFLATSFVILSIPGFVLALLGLVGRDGDESEIGWPSRIAGVGLLALGVMLAYGLLA